jgi:tetratricopeptide (TPR) repeat protein
MSQFMQLGQSAIQNKNIAEAVDWFTKALEEHSKDPQIKACLGQSLCWLGKRDEGIMHFRHSGQLLLKKARKNRDNKLALDLVEQLHYWNDYSGALEICKHAVLINPGFVVRGYQLLALTNSRLNQKNAALAAGRKALQWVPNSAMPG